MRSSQAEIGAVGWCGKPLTFIEKSARVSSETCAVLRSDRSGGLHSATAMVRVLATKAEITRTIEFAA
jgi:hypothetical protein